MDYNEDQPWKSISRASCYSTTPPWPKGGLVRWWRLSHITKITPGPSRHLTDATLRKRSADRTPRWCGARSARARKRLRRLVLRPRPAEWSTRLAISTTAPRVARTIATALVSTSAGGANIHSNYTNNMSNTIDKKNQHQEIRHIMILIRIRRNIIRILTRIGMTMKTIL